MKKADIDCYRINYDIKSWRKAAEGDFVMAPMGVFYAIKALCDEVERLKRLRRRKQ